MILTWRFNYRFKPYVSYKPDPSAVAVAVAVAVDAFSV